MEYRTYEGYPQALSLISDDGSVSAIPMDPANRHYQEYLKWVAEGNTALVIEEPTDG